MSNIIVSPSGGIIEFNTGIAGEDTFFTSDAPIRLDAAGGNSWITGSDFGIGTTDPSYPLHIGGTNTVGIYLDIGYPKIRTNRSSISLQTDDETSRFQAGDNYLYLSNNGSSSQFRLQGSNVGIGTTGPSADLHVNSSNNIGFKLQHASRPTIQLTDGTNSGYVGLDSGSSIITGTSDNDLAIRSPRNIVFGGNSVARMSITNAGNVGIGTTSPVQKLQVDGNIRIESVSYASLVLDRASTGTSSIIQFENNGGIVGAVGGYLDDGLIFNTKDGTQMIINASNNVGIGTTNPSYKLEIDGGDFLVNTTNSGYVQVDDSDNSLKLSDNVVIKLGTGSDFQMLHNGSSSSINNYLGNLFITQTANDANIIFRSDDGSGGITTYLTIDGLYEVVSFNKNADFRDNVKATFGGNGDLQIYHNGSHSYIANNTGDLEIINNTNDGDIKFISDDGSGGTTTYMTIDGGAVLTRFIKGTKHLDNVLGAFGDGADLTLSHDATNSHIANSAGHLKITQNADDKDIIFNCDDGSGGNTAYLTLDGSSNGLTVSAPQGMVFFDNIKAKFGNNDDLQIYHDGSNSFITDSGAGNLIISSNFLTLSNAADTEYMAKLVENGAVELYYNGSKKFETTASGISVAGSVGVTNIVTNRIVKFNGSILDDSLMVDDGTNIGIGESSPVSKLHVYQNDAATSTTAGITIEQDGTGDAQLQFLLSNAYRWVQGIDNSDGDKFKIGRGNAWSLGEDVTITTSGNVLVNGAEDNSGKADFAVSGGTVLSFRNNQVQMGGSDMNWNSKIFDDGQAKWAAWDRNIEIFSTGSNTGSAAARDIIFSPQTSGSAASTERMRIKGSGNVGIGTASPSAKLDVIGNVKTTGLDLPSNGEIDWANGDARIIEGQVTNYSLSFQNWNGSALVTNLFIKGDGNVGIGTTSPVQKLQVNGSIYSNGGEFYVNDNKGITAVGNLIFKAHNGSSYFEGMRINSAGNVGIGTASPYAYDTTATKLHVKNTGSAGSVSEVARFEGASDADGAGSIVRIGTSNDRGVYLEGGRTGSVPYASIGTTEYNGAKTEGIRIDSSGNVGIGTTSPSYRLDISGNSTSGVIAVRNAANGRDTFRSENAAGVRTFNIGNDSSGHGLLLVRNNSGTIINHIAGSGNSYFNTGNVGIGTTGPAHKLDVAGNARIGSSSQTTTSLYLTATNTAGSPAMAVQTIMQGYEARGLGTFYTDTSYSGEEWFNGINYSGSFDRWSIGYDSSGGQAEYLANAKFTVYYNGNVGIGTTNPSDNLTVEGGGITLGGTGRIQGIDTVSVSTDAANKAYVDAQVGSADTLQEVTDNGATTTNSISIHNSSLNVNPRLSVGRNGGESIQLHVSDNTNTIQANQDSDSNGDHIFALNRAFSGTGYNDFQIQKAGSAQLTIDTSGNVGIGTTSPNTRLYVSDSIAGYVSTIENLGTGADKSGLWVKTDSSWTSAVILKLTGGTSDTSIMEVNPATVRIGGGNLTQNDAKLHVQGTSFFFDQAIFDDKVGIGTTSPNVKLHVEGDPNTAGVLGRFYGSNTHGALLQFHRGSNYSWLAGIGGGSASAGVPTSYFGIVENANQPRLVIAHTSGYVGIGTTSPSQLLHVEKNADDSNPRLLIKNTDGGTSARSSVQFNNDGSGTSFIGLNGTGTSAGIGFPNTLLTQTDRSEGVAFVSSNASGRIRMFTGGTASAYERMRIDSSGNVGIGTTSPSAPLTVNGTTNDGSTLAQFVQAGTGRGFSVTRAVSGATRQMVSFAQLHPSGGSSPVVHIQQSDTGETALAISTDGSTENFTVSDVGDVYTAGSVGIGADSPSAKLNVTDGGSAITISNTYLGHFQSASNAGIAITAGSSSNNYIAFGDTDNYDEGIISYNNSTRSFAFRTADGALDDLVIDSSGNVGIGITSPAYELDVAGDIALDQWLVHRGNAGSYFGFHSNDNFRIQTDNTTALTVTDAQKVGIGTTGPTEKLEINGNTYTRSKTRGIATNYATSEGWAASTAVSSAIGYFGGSFNSNGPSSENKIEYDIGPFGLRELIWKTIPETGNNDDGGWNKVMDSFDNSAANGFISVVYVKRSSSTSAGNFYHGCHPSSTNNLDGNANTNPYFHSPSISNLPENVWCVSIGVIYAANDSNTTTSTLGGIYRLDTGVKISSSTTFRQKPSNTLQQQRVYHYYSTSPTAKLDFAKPAFYVVDGSEPTLSELTAGAAGGDDVYWTANGNDIYNDNTGNVGIGTTSPAATLDVKADTDTSVIFGRTKIGSYVTDNSYISHIDNASSVNYALKQNSAGTTAVNAKAGQNVSLNVTNSPILFVKGSNSFVGIGTNSPDTKLHVVGSNYENFTVQSTSSGYAPASVICEAGNSNSRGAGIFMHNTVNDRIWYAGTMYSDNSNAWNLSYNSDASALGAGRTSIAQNSYSLFTVTNTGKVGIGTTSPTNKLDIRQSSSSGSDVIGTGAITIGSDNPYWTFRGTATSLQDLAFDRNYSGTWYESMRIQRSTGNVGIGTTNPSAKLEVAATATTSVDIAHFSNSNGVVKINHSLDAVGSGKISILDASNNEDIRLSAQGDSWFNAGNVGIGTTSPDQKLEVNGNAQITASDPRLVFEDTSGSTYNADWKYKDNIMRFVWGGGEKMSITSNGGITIGQTYTASAAPASGMIMEGRLGIGTTSPSRPLHIIGQFAIDNSTSPSGGLLVSPDGNSNKVYSRTGNANTTAHPLDFISGSSTSMRIAANGDVGIGTTSPSVALDVVGRLNVSGITNINGTYLNVGGGYGSTGSSLDSSGNIQANGYLHVDGNVGIGTTSPTASYDRVLHVEGSNPTIRLETNASSGWAYQQYASPEGDWSVGINDSDQFVIAQAATLGSSAVRMVIDDSTNGNVGIGTTSPSKKLEVNVGGTSSDGILVVGSLNPHIEAKDSTNSVRTAIASEDSLGKVGTISSTDLKIVTSNSERIRVDTSGNVGIGTTSPAEKLEVDGNIRTSGNNSSISITDNGNDSQRIILSNNSGVSNINSVGGDLNLQVNSGEKITVKSDGNVGIGTTSPSYKLDVNGGIRAGGKITYHKSAGSLNTTGYAVAGLTSFPNGNGASAGFTFTCFGHTGDYQKIVYSCYNSSGTWNTQKVIDEGTNDFDVVASANGSTITFTFKSTSGTKSYTPRVSVEAFGSSINNTYA